MRFDRITDDRGNQLPTRLEWSFWHGAHRVPLSRAEAARAWKVTDVRSPPKRFFVWLGFALSAVSLALWLYSYPRGGIWGLSPALVFLTLGWTAFWRSKRSVLNESPSLLGKVMVRIGRCGVCAYELKGLEPEADGCVVCPECGAAWKTTSSTH